MNDRQFNLPRSIIITLALLLLSWFGIQFGRLFPFSVEPVRLQLVEDAMISSATGRGDLDVEFRKNEPISSLAELPLDATDDLILPFLAERQKSIDWSKYDPPIDGHGGVVRQVGSPGEVGIWSPLENWPVHATHAVLMPDNSILSWHWSSAGIDLYDVEAETHLDLTFNDGYAQGDRDLFCAGFTHLPDGRLFLNGGNLPGATTTFLFDSASTQFTQIESSQYERYYAAATTLGSGDLLIFGGHPEETNLEPNDYPEIYRPGSGWRTLTAAPEVFDHQYYQWVQQAPNGDVFYAGPLPQLHYLNVEGDGAWIPSAWRDTNYRTYGSYAFYDVGKVLVAGGFGDDGVSLKSARRIELSASDDQVVVSPVGDMAHPRIMMNMTIMANGELLVFGGNHSNELTNFDTGILPTEIWNPATGQWREVAPLNRTRQYHTAGLLLPDGRIFAAGGGSCAGCLEDLYLDAEFYSPPYLFNVDGSLANRPEITLGPEFLNLGTRFHLRSPHAAEIERAHLIKLGSSTHSQDMTQRLIPLRFQTGGELITLDLPENPNVAVPGPYMLFLVNEAGVPSVAHMVNVEGGGEPRINGAGDMLSLLGEPINFALNLFVPRDGDEGMADIELTATGLPTGITARLTPEGILLSGEGTASGPFDVTLSVSVGDQADTLSFQWEISAETYNIAPTLEPLADQENLDGDVIDMALVAADFENGPLLFDAIGLPAGLTIDEATGQISGVISLPGEYKPRITVTDDQGATASIQFQWIVTTAPLLIEPLVTEIVVEQQPIRFEANANGGSDFSYRWYFGDGSPAVPFTTTRVITHTFAHPGRYEVVLTVQNGAGTENSVTAQQIVIGQSTTYSPRSSSTMVYLPSVGEASEAGSAQIWNVNSDNDSVTVYDLAAEAVVTEIDVGDFPQSIALHPNGTLWVANKGSDTLSIIDAATLSVTATVDFPGGSRPHGLVIDPTGTNAYLSLEGTGELVKLNGQTGEIVDRLAVGAFPRHITLDGHGTKLYVSQFITPPLPGESSTEVETEGEGGRVIPIALDTFEPEPAILLRYSDALDSDHSGSGLPNYLGPVAISPDGRIGYVPSKQDNLTRGLLRNGEPLDVDNTVRSISSYIDFSTGLERYSLRIDHDDGAMPVFGAVDPFGLYYYVVLEGSREVRVIDIYSGFPVASYRAGYAPRAILFGPDGKRAFVHNYLDRTIDILDISDGLDGDLRSLSQIGQYGTVTDDVVSADVMVGKKLFFDGFDARLSSVPYLTCAACHSEGGHDGRTWDFSSMGEGLRNTIPLNGRAGMGHGRLHWSGNFDEIQDFENQIRELNAGTGLMSTADFEVHVDPLGTAKAGISADLDALALYVSTLDTFPRNPNIDPGGYFSVPAEAGRLLFIEAGCASCHSGPDFTDSVDGQLHDIGTLQAGSGTRLGVEMTGLDTPTLIDVWASGPYLHDGSAPTLEVAIGAHDGVDLSADELGLLSAYLLEIEAGLLPTDPARRSLYLPLIER